MSLENKRSSLVNFNESGKRSGKDVSRFGTIYKSPNSMSDIERTATPVDAGGKSKINKTVPVHMIPQPEPIKEVILVDTTPVEKPVKEEEKAPVEIKKIEVFTSGSTSATKF